MSSHISSSSSPSSSSSSSTREYTFLFIYQLLNNEEQTTMNTENLDQQILDFNKSYNQEDDEKRQRIEHETNHQLAKFLIESCIINFSLLVETLNKQLKKKKFNALNKIEQALLLVAIAEHLYIKDTPYAVIITEYMKLAEIYSNNVSSKFINGVLDALLRN